MPGPIDRHYYEYPTMEHGGAGCIVLARSTGRILLVERSIHVSDAGTWSGVGGGIDKGETPEECARRELWEEVKFSGKIEMYPLLVYQAPRFKYHNFLALVDDEFDAQFNWEAEQAQWFRYGSWPQPLHPGLRALFADSRSRTMIESQIKRLDLQESAGGFGLPQPYNPSNVDPALMTYREYYTVANETGKTHSDSAYDFSISDMNKSGVYDISEFPKLIRRMKVKGLEFEVRMRSEPLRYCKLDPQGDYIRDPEGQLVFFTPEEIAALGRKTDEHMIVVYNDKKQAVAAVQDEWNCVLVVVAREYRGFGFGPFLTKIARTLDPAKTSGGFTPSGSRNFKKVYQEFVADALKSGRYREMVRSGQMTMDRVREIAKSAMLPRAPARLQDVDFSSNDPDDWLLFGEYNCFIIYDRKLKDVWRDGPDHFVEDMIKGLIYADSLNERYAIMKQYGGEDKVRPFLLALEASRCSEDGVTLLIDEEDIRDINPKTLKVKAPTKKSGYSRAEAEIVGEPIDYKSMMLEEQRFRKSFDQYDEFKNFMVELAFGKYQNA